MLSYTEAVVSFQRRGQQAGGYCVKASYFGQATLPYPVGHYTDAP